MTTEKKYCEDCRFCDAAAGISYARCNSPKSIQVADGGRYVARELDKPGYASSQRNMKDRCGPDAVWFDPKVST